MQEIIQKTINELNKILPRQKKIKNEDKFLLIDKNQN